LLRSWCRNSSFGDDGDGDGPKIGGAVVTVAANDAVGLEDTSIYYYKSRRMIIIIYYAHNYM
jgi:hypothetical protein